MSSLSLNLDYDNNARKKYSKRMRKMKHWARIFCVAFCCSLTIHTYIFTTFSPDLFDLKLHTLNSRNQSILVGVTC